MEHLLALMVAATAAVVEVMAVAAVAQVKVTIANLEAMAVLVLFVSSGVLAAHVELHPSHRLT
jgi:hypothetical protein